MRPHQYIERKTGNVCTEDLYGDRIINHIYSTVRESAPILFRALTSRRMSDFLSYLNYDSQICARLTGATDFMNRTGIDLSECVEDWGSFQTLRDVFERKIRYWETRPMPDDNSSIVSPADAKLIVGSFMEASQLFIKNKFFSLLELLGGRFHWSRSFEDGDFAIFRLTPEKYHYNHLPVSGIVVDHYEIEGSYHSCNPGAVITVAQPNSKNKRIVTIMDTDIDGGTLVGLVAMVEVVALMIGDIVQCYSESYYEEPREIRKGMFLAKGQPKSLYRPGSSTDILIFQKDRIKFSDDIITNLNHPRAISRCSLGLGRAVVETEVSIREEIGQGCVNNNLAG